MKGFILLFLTFTSVVLIGQGESKKVLFLGNSYTAANNLPQMISNAATSVGDTLIWDMEAPGGFYFYQHLASPASINKIEAGNWDYVVLQDQSQATTLPTSQMAFGFNSARELDSAINVNNTCVETMFYMTWGRENGDPFYYQVYFPWYADSTYEYMDSLIQDRYMQMADDNNAEVSPVGAVWRYVRENHSSINLYQSDGSHPSISGSYLAACCFYTSLFRKDPRLITFHSSLPNSDAIKIKNAVKLMVYDSLLNWNIGKYDSINNVNCLPNKVKKMRQNSILNYYPNPVKNELTIQFESVLTSERIQVYNASGHLVQELKAQPTTVVKTDKYPTGIYFIRVKSHPEKAFKFIKN